MSCCDQPDMQDQNVWYRNVRVGASVFSFANEQEARDFLSKEIDDMPENSRRIHAALKFRRDQAYC